MKHIDVLLQNKPLKKAIVEIALKNKLPFKYLCKESGIKYRSFMERYIRVVDASEFEVEEDNFLRLLSLLGISVRTTIVVNPDHDVSKVAKELTEKYEKDNDDEET